MAAGLGTLPWQGREQRMLGAAPGTTFRFGDEATSAAPLTAVPLSPQFRENIKDVLPSLPSQDDYYLLKWLRGKPGGTVGLGQTHGGCGHRAEVLPAPGL